MRKQSFICGISAVLLLFTSCSDYEFQQGEQHDGAFSKVVTIEDLVYLHEHSSKASFAQQLTIEATVVGFYEDYVYLSDHSKYGLRMKHTSHSLKSILFTSTNTDEVLNIGTQISLSVAGLSFNSQGGFFDLLGSPSYEIIGQGNVLAPSVTLTDLVNNSTLYSSKLISMNGIENILLQEEDPSGKYYSFTSDGKQGTFFIPYSVDYIVPKQFVSLTGFIRLVDTNPVIHIRGIDDIQEIYVEPLMIEKIMNNSTLVKALIHNVEQELAPGVKMAKFSYTNSDNLLTSGTLFEVDMNNSLVKIEGGSPNDAPPPFSAIQPLATMASHKNSTYDNSGWRVLMAMTGDFYSSTAPFTLNGPFVVNGNVHKSDFTGTTDNFFGVLKDRNGFIIGGRTEFNTHKDAIDHAVGGRIILKDGNIVQVPAVREPRTAIGYTTKNKVYLFVGNGRMTSVSNGYSPLELAQLLKALGCEGGLYGNGGGATVGVLESEDGSYIKYSESHATNVNHNPGLASAWMIVTKR